MSQLMTDRYVATVQNMLAKASELVAASENDVRAREELADRLETALDLVCMQNNLLHRPQIDVLAPPMLD